MVESAYKTALYGANKMSVAYLKYHNLIFVVPEPPTEDEMAEYMYEEKLCPQDVLLKLQAVLSIEDDLAEDEHGLFEYLGQSSEYDVNVARKLIADSEETR